MIFTYQEHDSLLDELVDVNSGLRAAPRLRQERKVAVQPEAVAEQKFYTSHSME